MSAREPTRRIRTRGAATRQRVRADLPTLSLGSLLSARGWCMRRCRRGAGRPPASGTRGAPWMQSGRMSNTKGRRGCRGLEGGRAQTDPRGTESHSREAARRPRQRPKAPAAGPSNGGRPPLVQKVGRRAPKREKISEVGLGFILRLPRK